jgi:hypothetical protein
MIFEANGIENVKLLPHHNKNGIFLTKAIDRIKKYKGRCFLKKLNKPILNCYIQDFNNFVNYALTNFYYDLKVLKSSFSRLFNLRRFNKGTDCSQLVFLSLIKLNLLPISEFDNNTTHILNLVCYIKDLSNGYKYGDFIEIIDHPFSD